MQDVELFHLANMDPRDMLIKASGRPFSQVVHGSPTTSLSAIASPFGGKQMLLLSWLY